MGTSRMEGATNGSPPCLRISSAISTARLLSRERTRRPSKDMMALYRGGRPRPALLVPSQFRERGLLALQVRHSFFHPCRGGGALQEVVEVLLHADGVVLLVGAV